MNWKKGIAVGIFWIAIFVVLLIAIRYENQEPVLNAYSQECPARQFQVNGNCEPAHQCTTDADCEYLLIEQLPTRVGMCSGGVCKAMCGSGILRECR